MWPRVVETMLACWLAISPLVFQRAEASGILWAIDLTAAALVATLALLSYWPPARHAHLVIIVVGLALVALGMWRYPPQPADQNHVLVGLFLLLMAIIPNDASQPPKAWREFDEPH